MQFKVIKKIITNPTFFLYFLDKKRIITLPDSLYLKFAFKYKMDHTLDLNNVQTFNEKLQFLKLYDRNNNYTKMVDKYEAKKYVANIIGEEYIIPTLGIYNKFKDINFDNLPNEFVMKCTHDSGGIIVCKDKSKLNIKNAKEVINKNLKRNYYYNGREWPYKNVKPRIIIEKHMEDNGEKDIKDYKFFCFNGKVKFFKIDFDRFINHKANYYDIDGNLLRFGEEVCPPDFNKELKMPNNLKKMIELAEKLSKNIKFIRVDFYEIDNKIYFGELTFYPASGFGKFIPEEYDLKLGKLINLEGEKNEDHNCQ